LIVSDDVFQEYVEVLSRLGVADPLVTRLKQRFADRTTVTHVSLGSRPKLSRDPDDNVMIATARSGNAKFLVTNDRDLLDISTSEQARLRMMILTPAELLTRLRNQG